MEEQEVKIEPATEEESDFADEVKPVEVPGKVRFVAEIPLNDRGKVDKKSLLCAKTP